MYGPYYGGNFKIIFFLSVVSFRKISVSNFNY